MTAPRTLLFALLLSGIARAGPCPTGPATKDIVNDALLRLGTGELESFRNFRNYPGLAAGSVRHHREQPAKSRGLLVPDIGLSLADNF